MDISTQIHRAIKRGGGREKLTLITGRSSLYQTMAGRALDLEIERLKGRNLESERTGDQIPVFRYRMRVSVSDEALQAFQAG